MKNSLSRSTDIDTIEQRLGNTVVHCRERTIAITNKTSPRAHLCDNCANGTLDPGEDCDGNELDGATCETLSMGSGVLACTNSCAFDTSGCNASTCGDYAADTRPVCQGCLETNCCTEMATCDTDGCTALAVCVTACGTDLGCADGCRSADPTATAAATALHACLDTSCTAECPGAGVCETDYELEPASTQACLSASCCAAIVPCHADAACQACMDGSGTNCGANALYAPVETCTTTNCPSTMCGTDIGFNTPDGPNFDCNLCASANCCSPLTTCAGGGTPGEVNECLDCLNGAPASMAGAIQTAAQDFNMCVSNNCSTQCGG